jgi:hypothetical protein
MGVGDLFFYHVDRVGHFEVLTAGGMNIIFQRLGGMISERVRKDARRRRYAIAGPVSAGLLRTSCGRSSAAQLPAATKRQFSRHRSPRFGGRGERDRWKSLERFRVTEAAADKGAANAASGPQSRKAPAERARHWERPIPGGECDRCRQPPSATPDRLRRASKIYREAKGRRAPELRQRL